jgi:hypothetical protein
LLISFLDKINYCNQFNPAHFFAFRVNGQQVGYIEKKNAAALLQESRVFYFQDDAIYLAEELSTPDQRTAAVEQVVIALQNAGVIRRWGNEYYPVSIRFHQPPFFTLQRCAAPFFGIRTYGTHLNGYTLKNGIPWMWIARRASHMNVLPGKLDNLAAGGLPIGLSPDDNMRKETAEEAQLPASIIGQMKSVSMVSCLRETAVGASPDTLFVYDLQLPENSISQPGLDEVESIALHSMEDLFYWVSETDEFKYNSGLVIIDFLIRHGQLRTDHPDYIEIVHHLRHNPLFPLSPSI